MLNREKTDSMMKNAVCTDYYIGLDMGTSSVGWAVTDPSYNLLRAKGKDLWGVRKFSSAETSAKQRAFRISRRRNQRKTVRIGLLKEMFHDALDQVDPNFLLRLENSKYHLEDKDSKLHGGSALFDDDGYTDADYYKEYPTISHLRLDLIRDKSPKDVRLVFLAILHIFKHRGHFLFSGIDDGLLTMEQAYLDFMNVVNTYFDEIQASEDAFFQNNISSDEMESILSNRAMRKKDKKEALAELFDVDKKNKLKLVPLSLLAGLKVDLKKDLPGIESDENLSVCFSDYNYDEYIDQVSQHLEQSLRDVLNAAKAVYDVGVLSGIMKGKDGSRYSYISEARVADYEKHASDLKLLKQFVRQYAPDQYKGFFSGAGNLTYCAYVNSNTKDGKRSRRKQRTTGYVHQADLYQGVKKIIEPVKDAKAKDVKEYILKEMEAGTFLPKQMSGFNGVIPYQMHLAELRIILDNASAYLPFLNEVDESGLSVKEKIASLFSFRIPYFVGPTTEDSKVNGNGWIVRNEEGKVLPWTMEKVIDMEATSKAFVHKLIRNCTYISGEKVLPKCSLMYERFAVLNELNAVCVNGERLPVHVKQAMYHDLFETGQAVTEKKIKAYLRNAGFCGDDAIIKGIDGKVRNKLTSFALFYSFFGEKIREDKYIALAEDVVMWSTVFSGDRVLMKKNLEEKYGGLLTQEQIRKLCMLRFKDWGKLSMEFLCMQGCFKPTGEIKTVLDAMWDDESSMVLQELLFSDLYTFKNELDKKRTKCMDTLFTYSYDEMEDMYFSAPVRRMIWQTLKVLREVVSAIGYYPSKVFVETTRSKGKKGSAGRTKSREKQLLDLYNKIPQKASDKDKNKYCDVKEMKQLIQKVAEDGSISKKLIYLYLMQMGRDIYTAEPIDLSNLLSGANSNYDIDHIYPQSLVKDDSLRDNKVLTTKHLNQVVKGDDYPVPASARNNPEVRAFWDYLLKYKFITREKYDRLVANEPLSDDVLASFIKRQVVETGQATSGAARILQDLLPDSQIVYVKPKTVSDFRKDFRIYKSRIINDDHHAHDAYLNIVVGNAYNVKFTNNPRNFMQNRDPEKQSDRYNFKDFFKYDICRGKNIAWIAQKGNSAGTIGIVKNAIENSFPMITMMTEVNHGILFNATKYPASKAAAKPQSYVPIKSSDTIMHATDKYGGFSTVHVAYFFLVEYEEKGERVRSIEKVPIMLCDKVSKSSDALKQYCIDILGLVDPSIRVPMIPLKSLIKMDGYFYYITAADGNSLSLSNAVSLHLDKNWNDYIHYLEKYVEYGSWMNQITKEKNIALYDILTEKHKNAIFKNRCRQKSFGDILADIADEFTDFEMLHQAKALLQILRVTGHGLSGGVDLSEIDRGKSEERLRINKKISSHDELILIHRSPSGLYEKKVDLLKV